MRLPSTGSPLPSRISSPAGWWAEESMLKRCTTPSSLPSNWVIVLSPASGLFYSFAGTRDVPNRSVLLFGEQLLLGGHGRRGDVLGHDGSVRHIADLGRGIPAATGIGLDVIGVQIDLQQRRVVLAVIGHRVIPGTLGIVRKVGAVRVAFIDLLDRALAAHLPVRQPRLAESTAPDIGGTTLGGAMPVRTDQT